MWFQGAMQQALQPIIQRLERIEETLEVVKRRSFNASSTFDHDTLEPPPHNGIAPQGFPTTVAALYRLTATTITPVEEFYEIINQGNISMEQRKRAVAQKYGLAIRFTGNPGPPSA